MKRKRKTKYSTEETKRIFEELGEITGEERRGVHSVEGFLAFYGDTASLKEKCNDYCKYLLEYIAETKCETHYGRMLAYEYTVKLMDIVESAIDSMSDFD
jgi:hypothetical protein